MSTPIVQRVQRITTVLTSGIAFLDIGILTVDMGRAEVILDCRTGQSTVNMSNMWVTAELTSSTNVRLQRGGNLGAMTCHFIVVLYTAASGVVVDRGSAILNAIPLNIPIISRARANRYSRVTMRTSSNTAFKNVMATHDISSDNNLQIVGDAIDTSISFVWQATYIPDATVHHLSGLATGSSYDVSLSGLGVVKEQAYAITSMRFGGSGTLDDDEFKGANISSDNNLNMYSVSADDHYFVTQIAHRAKNRVERNDSSFAATSFSVNWLDPVDWNSSYSQLCGPYGYAMPTTFSNNAQNFMATTRLDTDYAITLEKHAGLQTTRAISEVIYIDGAGGIMGRKNLMNLYRGAFRRNG